MPALWPNGTNSPGTVTREFGFRSNIYARGYHEGIDTINHANNHAAVAGVVIMSAYNGTAGNEVRVRGDDGHHYRYMHHARNLVSNGQRVSAGQAVGVQGATGMVTGKHCHYEIWINGGTRNTLNPRTFHAEYDARYSNGTSAKADLSKGQRTTGSGGAKRRAQPTTQSESLDNPLSAGEIGNFDGWIHGENVSGNNVWYRGISGHWFWSGGFVEGANGTGLTDLNPASLAGNQRKVLTSAPVMRRSGPSTKNPTKDPQLEAGTVGNFDGWIRGESVNGNDIWFRGTSGDWFWSGGFTDTGTHDLADLNPTTPVLAPNQRKVLGSDVANRRTEPKASASLSGEPFAAGSSHVFDLWTRGESVAGNDVWFRHVPSGSWSWSGGFEGGAATVGLTEHTTAPVDPGIPASNRRTVLAEKAVNGRTGAGTTFAVSGSLDAGSTHEFNAWAEGENVSGVKVWFRHPDGRWFWAGGFTSQSTDGLTKVDAPKPSNQLDLSYKTFKSDTPLAKWIGSPNYNYRTPRPAGEKPRHITLHWMSGTLGGTDSHFQNPGTIQSTGRGDGTASNYGIGKSEIHQYVREQDYQQADGHTESNRYGVSIEHEGGPNIPVAQSTLDLSAQLCADIAKRNGWKSLVWLVNVFPHKHWVATQCPGTLDVSYIITKANEILNQVVDPEPEPQPEPEPVDEKAELREAWNTFKAKLDEYLS